MTTFKFISPSGEIVKGKNLKKFCDQNNLGYWSMYLLRSGEVASTRDGWRAFHKKSQAKHQRQTQQLYNIQTGETAVLGSCMKTFADRHNLKYCRLSQLLSGKRLAYNGWITENTRKRIYGQAIV